MLICVDLDGTLLDTVPANAASYRAALEELGFTVTDEYYAERCNGGHYTRFLPPLMGGAPSTADVERVHDRKKALYSDFLDAVRPNTALMEILKTMRAAGHNLACVTTGSKQNATEVLEHFGVREWFGLIVTGEDVEKQKPDPEGYCRAMEHFRVTPADTMIFEDSGIGLTAAKAFGRIRDDLTRAGREKQQKELLKQPEQPSVRQSRHKDSGVIVEDIDSCMIKFSRCCTPVPGDPIVGFITRGQGVSIHRADCPNYLNSLCKREKEGRWLNVSWADKQRAHSGYCRRAQRAQCQGALAQRPLAPRGERACLCHHRGPRSRLAAAYHGEDPHARRRARDRPRQRIKGV